MYPLTRTAESIEESAEACLAAGDAVGAIQVIAEGWPLLAVLRGTRLRELIGQVPEPVWRDDPRIIAALGASYRSIDSPSRSAALPHFEFAERLIEAGQGHLADLPSIQLHHAATLRSLGRLDSALDLAESAWAAVQGGLELTLPLRLTLQAEASLQLGLINLHLGDITTAVAQLRLASGLSVNGLTRADLVECLGGLAFAAYCSGDFEHAERLVGRARAAGAETTLLDSPFGAPALTATMLMAVDRNSAADARAQAAALAAAAHRSDWEPLAYYARAAAAGINGQLIEALDLQRRCIAAARGWEGAPAIRTLAEILRAGLHFHLGEKQLAAGLLADVEPMQDHIGCPGSLLAAIRFADGDFSGCLDALHGCRAIGDSHSSRSLIDVLLLSAASGYECGDLVASDVAFDRALYLGSQTGIRVPFLVVPRITMRMLNRAADRYQPDTVHRLLGELRVGSTSSGDLIEPLSDRELDIAHHLFQDKTVAQIAADLYISANTVKTHVRSIYRKLSATNRKEAIRRVHELGLDVKITPF